MQHGVFPRWLIASLKRAGRLGVCSFPFGQPKFQLIQQPHGLLVSEEAVTETSAVCGLLHCETPNSELFWSSPGLVCVRGPSVPVDAEGPHSPKLLPHENTSSHVPCPWADQRHKLRLPMLPGSVSRDQHLWDGASADHWHGGGTLQPACGPTVANTDLLA